MATLSIYTDGSFQENKGVWGFIAYDFTGQIHKNKGIIEDPKWNTGRQIAAECEGVIKALEWCREQNHKCTIYYDYIGLRAWVADIWGDKPWRTNKEYTILYRQKVLGYVDLLIDMRWVKGHSGVVGNESVDKYLRK